jgi:hypothetical protein
MGALIRLEGLPVLFGRPFRLEKGPRPYLNRNWQ